MENIIIVAVLIVVICLAVFYIYKSKKSGKKCIGCPDSGSCSASKCEGSCGCCGGCHGENEKTKN